MKNLLKLNHLLSINASSECSPDEFKIEKDTFNHLKNDWLKQMVKFIIKCVLFGLGRMFWNNLKKKSKKLFILTEALMHLIISRVAGDLTVFAEVDAQMCAPEKWIR